MNSDVRAKLTAQELICGAVFSPRPPQTRENVTGFKMKNSENAL